MARKYTSSTTKIEEIDGKMYATLTFTGVDLMSNHKIYVNGSVVSHSITSKTSSIISGSSALVGSSNRRHLGFMARLRAIAIRCFCPPDS